MRKYFYQTVTSTQDIAKRYIKLNNSETAYFVANEQTAGYGKKNRYFYSPAMQGLYLSVALPNFNIINEKRDLLTPAIATAIVKKLQSIYSDRHFTLKWVNDIYLNDRKIAGILTEQVTSGLVIGIGINLNNQWFPNELKLKAGSLKDPDFQQKNLTPTIVDAILQASKRYQTGSFLTEYKHLSLIINKMVTLRLGSKIIRGIIIDIDQFGHLVLQSQKKIYHLNNGEIINYYST